MDIDLLRRDECQPLTPTQINEIKSQFHPSGTANVNITPYHIYDEDECTVGEWRQTVDGVKKKKPVYEKYYSVNFSFPSNTYNWVSTGLTADGFDRLISGKFYNETYGQVCYPLGIGKVDGYIKAFGYAVGGFVGMTICYTKTTDEWEEV